MKNKIALFIKTKNIGDSIILTSAIAALPDEYKYVDIICLSESVEIFKMNPRVRNIYPVPRGLKGINKLFSYVHTFSPIFINRYDFVAQFSADWRGALLTRLLMPKLSVVRKSDRRGRFWHNSFSLICQVYRNRRPAAEQDVDLLRKANIYKYSSAPPYQISPPKNNFLKINGWLKENKFNKQKIVVIHAFSRWKFKEINLETWKQVISQLCLMDINIILSGSDDDYSNNLLLANSSKQQILIAKNFSLCDTAALFKAADMLISIDSMAIHLASAVGLPVLSLFGPTNEHNWAPWKIKHSVIALTANDSPSFACRPCGKDGCGGSKISNCLLEIKSEDIVKKAFLLIGANSKS